VGRGGLDEGATGWTPTMCTAACLAFECLDRAARKAVAVDV
jgi:hypothetical protein